MTTWLVGLLMTSDSLLRRAGPSIVKLDLPYLVANDWYGIALFHCGSITTLPIVAAKAACDFDTWVFLRSRMDH